MWEDHQVKNHKYALRPEMQTVMLNEGYHVELNGYRPRVSVASEAIVPPRGGTGEPNQHRLALPMTTLDGNHLGRVDATGRRPPFVRDLHSNISMIEPRSSPTPGRTCRDEFRDQPSALSAAGRGAVGN